MTPLFSILHPSVRAAKWKQIRDLWVSRAARPDLVEYLLGFHIDQFREFSAAIASIGPHLRTVVNEGRNHPTRNGRSSLVDCVNLLASKARGNVLIVAADDQEAPDQWDKKLAEAYGFDSPAPAREFVIQVSTGTPNDTNRPELMTLQILSRPRYERFGYVFHPRYTGMYADNEFSDVAHRDGVVIDGRHLVFQHQHPLFDPAVPPDEWYAAANASHEYSLGRAIYAARKACGFPPDPNWNGEY